MSMQVHDSLTRRLVPFEPADPNHVTVYACGPTVYNHAHIGNWSTNITADILVRWLRASGYGVRYVMNITDVEDKIIRDAQAAGEERAAFAERWTTAFFEDLETFGCIHADAYPRATEHIDGMVAMIQKLLDGGYAYAAAEEDGRLPPGGTIVEAIGQLSGEVELDVLLSKAVDVCTCIADADRSSLFLYDRDKDRDLLARGVAAAERSLRLDGNQPKLKDLFLRGREILRKGEDDEEKDK